MKKLNVKTIVFAAVLVAMNLVLSRVLAINIGSTLRITVSATPIYLASLWFGPLVGGICGGLGDLLGCLIQACTVIRYAQFFFFYRSSQPFFDKFLTERSIQVTMQFHLRQS